MTGAAVADLLPSVLGTVAGDPGAGSMTGGGASLEGVGEGR
jgi:hypothetical protein